MEKAEGSWVNGPSFFEQALGEKATLKACITTSPEGEQFVSIREWRTKKDGTPYFTRNGLLVPVKGYDAVRDAFVAALQAKPTPAKKSKAVVDHGPSNKTIGDMVASETPAAKKVKRAK